MLITDTVCVSVCLSDWLDVCMVNDSLDSVDTASVCHGLSWLHPIQCRFFCFPIKMEI